MKKPFRLENLRAEWLATQSDYVGAQEFAEKIGYSYNYQLSTWSSG